MTLRLLKVIIQPVFVEDDGETLTEIAAQPLPVPAKDWPEGAINAIEHELGEGETS